MQPRTARQCTKHGHGIAKKGNKYLAQIRIAPYLHAVTQCVASAEQAIFFHEVLIKARDLAAEVPMVATEPGPTFNAPPLGLDPTSFAQILHESISAACTEKGLAKDLLELSFCALVDAHALVGCTAASCYSTDLVQVLGHRSLLIGAKSNGWPQFRTAWIQVLSTSGQARPHIVGCNRSRKLQPKSVEEAIRAVDAARKNHLVRCQELDRIREARKLQRLELAVERAVKVAAATLMGDVQVGEETEIQQ